MIMTTILTIAYSHILKEQSNVDRHHPDLCDNRSLDLRTLGVDWATPSAGLSGELGDMSKRDTAADLKSSPWSRSISVGGHGDEGGSGQLDARLEPARAGKLDLRTASFLVPNQPAPKPTQLANTTADSRADSRPLDHRWHCLDPRPLFVAQSSICWYVLSLGLSCYLMDLLIRKFRRSKSSIQLLDFRSDSDGNLIELILSSNHKRFAHWLPGQFVYLNCPQIAAYEWHPFTISSMDNHTRQFSLHIKTGGDWTRKLRNKLVGQNISHQNSISWPNEHKVDGLNCCDKPASKIMTWTSQAGPTTNAFKPASHLNYYPSIVAISDCYNEKTGRLDVKCTKLVSLTAVDSPQEPPDSSTTGDRGHIVIHLDDDQSHWTPTDGCSYAPNCWSSASSDQIGLSLYIDGPFHSPFERLLEQQVSICIANGVGWTAFSSIFHSLTNNSGSDRQSDQWWTKWRHNRAGCSPEVTSLNQSKLHLMLIVTNIEQLKPFYHLGVSFFEHIKRSYSIGVEDPLNPIKEITAFLTRCE